ncbi:MAG: putative selenium-dependent hydroxylase accessory protein YqeC, partial [Tissierellia bacterium]|nr:putative selenium-dependent hydroxylase accessory protein YqeC [Tissierellia bacterium]
MNLIEKFEIKSKDVVSFVGSGGKTTTIFLLAKELSNYNNVLIITTTKMLIPKNKDIEFFETAEDVNNYTGKN